MMKRRALGKGLGSLIPEVPPSVASEGLKYLDPESMVPNRYQPRGTFDADEIASLAESIKKNGLLQPIVARPSEGGYEIVAGERRWRAARKAGLKRVPVIVQTLEDDRALEVALVENLQRKDLNPIEEARAFDLLARKFQLTQEQIASRVDKSRPAISNALRLLKLPQDIQDLIKSGNLTRGHARALLALESEAEIRAMATKMQSESMSVRKAEAQTRSEHERSHGKKDPVMDPNVRSAQDRLQSRLGTQVRIIQSESGRGRIEVHFDGPDELSRLFDGLMTARFT